MRLSIALALVGCSYLPPPETVAEYRDVCAAKGGRFWFSLGKQASTEWGPTYTMKCELPPTKDDQ